MKNPEVYDLLIKLLKDRSEIEGIALGGSRARKEAKEDSDFDIFVIVNQIFFSSFLEALPLEIENKIPEIIFMGKDKYLEEWGYMYCGIDEKGFFYDLAFITSERINEMAIRSDNLILHDPHHFLENIIIKSENVDYKSYDFLQSKYLEAQRMFYINIVRYIKSFKKRDYWMAFRFLNLTRESLMKCLRITRNIPSKLYFLADENFEKELQDQSIREQFIVDGKFETLNSSARYLLSTFKNIYPNDFKIDKIKSVYHFEFEDK